MRLTVILIFVYISIACIFASEFNPYLVLNVPKSAKLTEIRKSYKRLVKEWHPDKNSSPDAQDKFIQIQQAYEILSNEEKRNQYDTQGFTSDNNQQWNQQAKNFRYSDFFSHDFYDFGFDDTTSARSVSNHKFFHHVVPDSHHTPQILYVYSTFCARCIVILKTSWSRAAKDLEKLGVGVGTVDTTFSTRISSYLRVYSLPTIVMVFQEQYYYYNGMVSYENVKNFITSQLPQNLVQTITLKNLDGFLNGVLYDDKPRALLFSKQTQATLLYVLMSIKHQKYIRFGFVSLSDANGETIAGKYGVRGSGPTLLIFKEDPQSPAVTLQSSDMPRGAVNEILTLHRHMTVPRLTSQEVFDDLCPSPGDQSFHVSLCAIFASNDKRANHMKALNNLRELVTVAMESDDQLSDWLKFVFVIDNKQQAFVKSLSGKDELPKEPAIYLLWRRGTYRGFTTTFSSQFLESDVSVEYGFQKFLAACMQTAHQRQFERQMRISALDDELAPFVVTRLVMQGWKSAVSLFNMMRGLSEHESMLLLIITILIGLSLLSAFNNSDKKRESRSDPPAHHEESEGSDVEVDVAYSDEEENDLNIKNTTGLSFKELQPSSYEDLLLRKNRGHLTIVILLGKSDHVVDDFMKMMSVYEKDKRLSFIYLNTTSYISWYAELRKTSSAQPPGSQEASASAGLSSLHSNNPHTTASEPEITSVDSHGTVLACNGAKHWYCIFVPRVGRGISNVLASDLGDGDSVSKPVSDDDLPLRGQVSEVEINHHQRATPRGESEYYSSLIHWMDRVCEGQLPRLYVRQWPGLYARIPDDFDDEDS